MIRFIVETDTAANAKILISMLKHIDFVKNIDTGRSLLDKKQGQRDKPLKKLTDKDWIRPGRPATDEEHEEMLAECEVEYKAGKVVSTEELRKNVLKSIDKCRKKHIR